MAAVAGRSKWYAPEGTDPEVIQKAVHEVRKKKAK
jgi:hypothetical protein